MNRRNMLGGLSFAACTALVLPASVEAETSQKQLNVMRRRGEVLSPLHAPKREHLLAKLAEIAYIVAERLADWGVHTPSAKAAGLAAECTRAGGTGDAHRTGLPVWLTIGQSRSPGETRIAELPSKRATMQVKFYGVSSVHVWRRRCLV